MSRIRRNLASLMVSQVATFMLSLVTVTIVPKYLGPRTYGVLAFATAFVGFFALAASLGSKEFLVKTIARDPSQLGNYIFNALALKVVLAVVLSAAAIAVAHVLGYPPQTDLLVAIGCIGILLSSLGEILTAALQGTERIGKIAVWTGVRQYVTGAIGIGLLLEHRGVVAYALVLALGAGIPVLANGYQLWPEIHARARPLVPRWAPRCRTAIDLRLWRTIAAGGVPFLLWSGILLIYGSIDILMLQVMNGSVTVGWYTLAYTWVGIPVFLPSLVVTVVFPALSASALANSADFKRTVNRALQFAAFVGTPMAIGIALTAGNIIALFHYPAGFQQVVGLIRILAFHIPIVAIDMVLAIALAAKDRQKAWLVVGCIAAVFNPVVNLFAIPFTTHRFGDGAIGASVVTVATEVLMMVGAIYLRPEGVLDRATVSFVLRSVMASAAMIPAVLLARRAPLAVEVLIGVATFCVAAVILRLVSLRASRDGAIQVLRSFRQSGRLSPLPTGVE